MALQRVVGEKGQRNASALTRFIEQMTTEVCGRGDQSSQVERTVSLLTELVQDPSWLRPEWTVPSSQQYARHPVYLDPEGRFEVLALVWLPGQETLLHDHDGTWGVEGVVRGTITVTNYQREESPEPGLVRLRELGTEVLRRGQTGQVLPPADCHVVGNRGGETAISIHVYGKPLRRFRVFRVAGEPGLYRAEWVQAPAICPALT